MTDVKRFKKLLSATKEQWKEVQPILSKQGIMVPWDEYNPIEHIMVTEHLRHVVTKKINFDELIMLLNNESKILLISKLFNYIGLSMIEREENNYEMKCEDEKLELIMKLFKRISHKEMIKE